ncbi:glycosyltransferase family 2 protein [Hyphococcus sp.]|uniref:glycosyltransferase family 2 protein n=1 Tax=Hyphococcus sp. TaxID=2038636 RepID=UPI003CCBA95C
MGHSGFDQNRRFFLGIIIVNYRTPALVETCLASLEPQLAEIDAGVAIVDNASGDGSFEKLTRYCAASTVENRLKTVAAPKNGGFSAGNNVGFDAISSEYVLLLNSDAIARPTALAALARAAADNGETAIFTPQIVSTAGEPLVSRFRRHSLISEFVEGAQTGPVTKLFPAGETPIFPADETTSPDWVSFSAVMIRRGEIDKAGPMDEGFFLYFEDCEYCLRLKAQGANIKYVPDAVFEHDAGGTTKLREKQGAGARLPGYYYRSRSRYFRQLYGPAGPAIANIAWGLGRALARLRGLVGRPAPRVAESRARDIWIGWRGDRA